MKSWKSGDNYGGTSTGPATSGSGKGIKIITKRKNAIERFLRNYGFNTATSLKSQSTPRGGMAKQIGMLSQ